MRIPFLANRTVQRANAIATEGEPHVVGRRSRWLADPVEWFTILNDAFARNRLFPIVRPPKMVSTRERVLPLSPGISGCHRGRVL